jgi:hypothetical protein
VTATTAADMDRSWRDHFGHPHDGCGLARTGVRWWQ